MPFNNHNRSLLSLVHHSERDLHYCSSCRAT